MSRLPIYFGVGDCEGRGDILWLGLAIWGFCYDGQTDYLLAIVSGFLFIAVASPSTLALMVYRKKNSADTPSRQALMVYRQKNSAERKSSGEASLQEWMTG